MSTNKNKPEQQLITIPLSDLIEAYLGNEVDGISCAQVPMHIGIVLENKLQGSLKHKVVFDDHEGNPFPRPFLWRYNVWYASSERYYQIKAKSEKEQLERWILEKNVDNMAIEIMKTTKMEKKQALPIAYKLVKSGNKEVMEFMGLGKLITKQEEL